MFNMTRNLLSILLLFFSVFSSAQVLEKTRILDDQGFSPVLYSVVSFDKNKSSRTPFLYSSVDIYDELISGAAVYYAICKEKTETGVRLSCINNDLSIRFVFPSVVGKASRFIDGVSIVNTDQWGLGGIFKYGAISRQGDIIIPIQHDYVVQRGDRLVCCDINKSGCVMVTYDKSGNELFSHTFSIPSLGVFVQVGDIRREDMSVLNYSAEKTECRESFIKAMEDCLHLRYFSAIQDLQICLQCSDDEIVKAANETIEFIQRTMSVFPFDKKGLVIRSLFLRDELKHKISLTSLTGYKTRSTPFCFSNASVHIDYSKGKEEYYAVCKDSTGHWLCINEDLSLRFIYPEETIRASSFVAGVATIKSKSSKWGAIAHDGTVIIPMEYDLVMIRTDRIVAYKETKNTNSIAVYDLSGNHLYTQEFHISKNKNKVAAKILADADNEVAISSNRDDGRITEEDAVLLAIAKCIRLDYDAAYNYLSRCSKSQKCWIRKVARKNRAFVSSLLNKHSTK